jgi:hypothetical protein
MQNPLNNRKEEKERVEQAKVKRKKKKTSVRSNE